MCIPKFVESCILRHKMICDQISALLQLPKTAVGHFIKPDWTIDTKALDTVLPEICESGLNPGLYLN